MILNEKFLPHTPKSSKLSTFPRSSYVLPCPPISSKVAPHLISGSHSISPTRDPAASSRPTPATAAPILNTNDPTSRCRYDLPSKASVSGRPQTKLNIAAHKSIACAGRFDNLLPARHGFLPLSGAPDVWPTYRRKRRRHRRPPPLAWRATAGTGATATVATVAIARGANSDVQKWNSNLS